MQDGRIAKPEAEGLNFTAKSGSILLFVLTLVFCACMLWVVFQLHPIAQVALERVALALIPQIEPK